MKLSIVIPMYNGSATIRRCLDALFASSRRPDQVIIVDDGSTDNSLAIVREYPVQIVAMPDGPRGAAIARNWGAEHATGDVLIFIDADAAVHRDTLALIERYLTRQPDIDALFGSYDDEPAGQSYISRYKNLLHHYVHQNSKREASSFWTGCGAMRASVFAVSGGFNPAYAMIEDIELGVRLRRQGYRIWLCHDVQVTHLKEWTFASLLRTDIWGRAVPWTRLILHSGKLPSDLNLNAANRVSAIAGWCAVLGLFAGLFISIFGLASLALVVVILILNFDLYQFFVQRGGLGFGVVAVALHWLYLLYSSAVFGGMWILWRLRILRVSD
jgi:glycosyltransferase involved in cell wall biosynthesis